jgi:hypothetical protein
MPSVPSQHGHHTSSPHVNGRSARQLLSLMENHKIETSEEDEWVLCDGSSKSPYYAKVLPTAAEDDNHSCVRVQPLKVSPHNNLHDPLGKLWVLWDGRILSAKKDDLEFVEVWTHLSKLTDEIFMLFFLVLLFLRIINGWMRDL